MNRSPVEQALIVVLENHINCSCCGSNEYWEEISKKVADLAGATIRSVESAEASWHVRWADGLEQYV